MTINEYRELQRNGCVHYCSKRIINPLPSDTDGTQDVPVKNIQLLANGDPLNVIKRNVPFGAHIDNMSNIERRNNDAFDALAEQKQLEKEVATKLYKYKQLKSIKNDEN